MNSLQFGEEQFFCLKGNNMLILDDFLTRQYWFIAQKSKWGKRIPLDYATLSVEKELESVKEIKVKFMPFIPAYIIDMALGRSNKYGYGNTTKEALKKAVMWLVDNGVRVGAHGYYHTEQEWQEGYIGWAEKILETMNLLQSPPHIWRFPKQWEVNNDRLEKMGFIIHHHPDVYYDECLVKDRPGIFPLSESKDVMTHSFFLAGHTQCLLG